MESSTAPAGGVTAAIDAGTICEAFQITAAAIPDRVAVRTKGDEFSMTWGEYAQRVRNCALGLRKLGLERGGTIALMLNNRPEFHVADTAAMHLGATPFSIYQTLSAEQIAYLVDDSGAEVVVTEPDFLDRILETRAARPQIREVIVVGADQAPEGCRTLAEVEETGSGEDPAAFEEAWRKVQPTDLLTLIYTSGTTGPPKGVQIRHDNISAAIRSYHEVSPLPDGARLISYLPMAHIAERMVGHYFPITVGGSVTTCANAREIGAYLAEVHPTWFFGVPRIWEKLKAGLEAYVHSIEDENTRKGIEGALAAALSKVRLEQAGEQVPEDLAKGVAAADEMVFAKMRERIGLDQAEGLHTGAAPTPPAVLEFFHAIGLPIAELWGLSETCGAGCVNPPHGPIKIGSVGPPGPGIELRLAEDGEVLLRGGVVMDGYRNAPEQTAEAIDPEGWFHTGDIGELDGDGYLRIVDRKKELIINAAGKNMSPANIEAKLKSISLVGQACVIGDAKPYLTALLVLDPDVAPAWAKAQGLGDLSFEELSAREAVREQVAEGVEGVNTQVSRVEGIKKFTLIPHDWIAGGVELTPTMKLKRKPIAEAYAAEIEAMYAA